MARRQAHADLAGVAAIVQRLAVLLAAGVSPVSAWGYLSSGDGTGDRAGNVVRDAAGELASRVALAAADGVAIPDAILGALASGRYSGRRQRAVAPRSRGRPGGERPRGVALLRPRRPEREARRVEQSAWRGLATAWAVAADAGAPLAPTLRDFARSLRSLAQAQRDIQVALAAPASTARMVLALPAVGVLFGLLLGFNTFATLFTTPVGWVCLGIGGLLLIAAARWNRRLIRSASPRDTTPGLSYDLMAIAMSGGGSLDRARASVVRAVENYAPAGGSFGAESGAESRADDWAGADDDWAGIEDVLYLSRRAGVPAAELLRSEADEARRNARTDVQQRAAALAVRLMLPLGLCVLPAFMVLGVLPLIATVITSTVVGF